jgi:hypothetical protein
MQFENILYNSALIFFNIFCLMGILVFIAILFFISTINSKITNLSNTLEIKLAEAEENLAQWDWLGGPISAVVLSLMAAKRNQKVKQSSWFDKFFR